MLDATVHKLDKLGLLAKPRGLSRQRHRGVSLTHCLPEEVLAFMTQGARLVGLGWLLEDVNLQPRAPRQKVMFEDRSFD